MMFPSLAVEMLTSEDRPSANDQASKSGTVDFRFETFFRFRFGCFRQRSTLTRSWPSFATKPQTQETPLEWLESGLQSQKRT